MTKIRITTLILATVASLAVGASNAQAGGFFADLIKELATPFPDEPHPCMCGPGRDLHFLGDLLEMIGPPGAGMVVEDIPNGR